MVRLRGCAGRAAALAGVGAAILASASTPSAAARPTAPVVVPAPVRLEPDTSSPISVAGLHAYLGTVEMGSAPDGIVIVDRISLERYLLGLDEVPTSWPAAALRAQAVAARTYALWTLARPPAGAAATYGFDICASDQCQVFSGADSTAGEDPALWAAAVEGTAGRAVLYRGRSILARYHSTSGGMTLANSEAFPGSPNLPYLQPVPSPHELASPLYRWRVTFRLPALQELLTRAGWWNPGLGPLVDVRTPPGQATASDPDVVLRGARGSLSRSASSLRETLRTLAPAMWPSRYPSHADTSSGRLPETLPSSRISIATRGGRAHIVGRGWGHGVGMSQWGARGMAERGATYESILHHYYTDTTVEPVHDPGPVRVGVAWGLGRTLALGSYRIVDGTGRTVVRHALGTWSFERTTAGDIRVSPPRHLGASLHLVEPRAPERARVGTAVPVTTALSAPALVMATISGSRDARGSPLLWPRGVAEDAGTRRILWPAPTRPGRYRVRVVAWDGRRRVSAAVPHVVVVHEAPGRGRAPGTSLPGTILVWTGATLLLVALAVGGASFVGTMRR